MNNKIKIDGIDGEIVVSHTGRIWHNGTEKKQYFNKSIGYKFICFYDPETKAKRLFYVHRLVALAFIPNPCGHMFVDHIDNDRTHNIVSNLRWVSRKGNNSRKHARSSKAKNKYNWKYHSKILKIEKSGQIFYFKNGTAAAKFIGCTPQMVYLTAEENHYSKTAKGWTIVWIDRNEAEGKEVA